MAEMEDVYNFESPNIFPKDIKIYLPEEKGTTFLPDNASSLFIQAFLKMCNLKFSILFKSNIEDISPSGQMPLLKFDIFLLSGIDTVVQFFEERGISLTNGLDLAQKAEVKAYLSLVNMTLANAENFMIWADHEIYNRTKLQFKSVHPWPLNWILADRKQQKVLKKLGVFGWLNKTSEEVYEEIESCFSSLSHKLEGEYFFGNRPTEIDAMVFAHSYTILTTPLPKTQLYDVLLRYPKIVKQCKKVLNDYFPGLR